MVKRIYNDSTQWSYSVIVYQEREIYNFLSYQVNQVIKTSFNHEFKACQQVLQQTVKI